MKKEIDNFHISSSLVVRCLWRSVVLDHSKSPWSPLLTNLMLVEAATEVDGENIVFSKQVQHKQ